MTGLLAGIAGPADVRALSAEQLPELAREIRAELVATVSRTGGHLGPNLGVVELTLALHRVFTSPYDVLLWDTGHQTYVHKLLTGRRGALPTLRQPGGLSGYPSRQESGHDVVENSHASAALAWADGTAKAFALRGERDRVVVAVVGDGALTGGLAWEGLNAIAAAPDRPVVVVLNDNGRSYAPTVGALAGALRTAGRDGGTAAGDAFRSLGLAYLGPVDGHDARAVEAVLREARALRAPVLVHCRTVKGRGYPPAEQDAADCFHGIGAIDPATGRSRAVGAGLPWTEVFSTEILAIARSRPEVVGITAAMLRPVGLHRFAAQFPDRVFDVGIAEQHAVTSAAALASAGLHPVVAVYATFLTRAVDQLLMDVALHRLPVTVVLDRAGITGDDGPSHHGMWDLALLGAVPGLRVAAPRDAVSLRTLLREAVAWQQGPTVLRFPKAVADRELPAVDRVGPVDVLRAETDPDVLVVAVGALAGAALDAAEVLSAEGVRVAVVDPRWVRPVAPALVELAGRWRLVVTVEDGLVAGGVGEAVARAVRDAGGPAQVCPLGLATGFVPHGRRDELLAAAGLDAAGIASSVRTALDRSALPVG